MKKVKYYKKKTDRKKKWFSESWGEPLDVVLPNGKTLTGFLAQNKYLPNKTELNKYIKDENFLKALERITSQESYKNAEIELNNYKILYG